MENIIPVRFFVVTFLWSWSLCAILYLFSKKGVVSANNTNFYKTGFIFIVIGAFGPAVGATISLYSTNGREAVFQFFASFLSLNFGWKVWGSIFLVLVGSVFLAWIIPSFFGNKIPLIFHNIYKFPVIILIMTFLGGGQEEIGWRGYILPFLENKYGIFWGTLILGIIWTIWHLPLWFIPGSNQKNLNFFAFTLQCIGLSYFFSWVITASGNQLLSGLIAHGTYNAILFIFPMLGGEKKPKQIRYWINSILLFIIGIIIVAIRIYK
jgi:membrane protease YdiL (CAAX protease family)